MNPFEMISNNNNNFTKKEIIIANYVKENPLIVIQQPAEKIAEFTNTSKASIIRFCQKIGFEGYSEFKFATSRYFFSNSGELDIENSYNKTSIATITSKYSEKIMQINKYIDIENIDYIVNSLLEANKIKILGYNRTGLSALHFRLRASKIGFDCEAINDYVLMSDISNVITKDDLCIIFSIRASSFYEPIVKQIKSNNSKCILITMNKNSILLKHVEYFLILPQISLTNQHCFLDDQIIFFTFIEIILCELSKRL